MVAEFFSLFNGPLLISLQYYRDGASPMAAMQETQVWSLSWEDLLEGIHTTFKTSMEE